MRVLVTGGAGYIGGVVTTHLLERGHAAVVVDNLSRGHRDAVPEGVPLVEADLSDTPAIRRILSTHRIDAVVHLAAFALVGESMADPALYYRNNVVGGLSLLEAMRDAAVSRIVFSSTCAVYGSPVRVPIEETDPLQPTNPYGESKLVLERALRWHHEVHGLQFASLRYFNAAGASSTHGERHDPETHLIPIVLQAAAGLQPHITIFGTDYPTKDGTCVRDYIHVSDLAEAHELALRAIESGSCAAEVYNLGCGGAGYSVRAVVEIARAVTGRSILTREGPRRAGDPATLVASSEKAARELGWAPKLQSLPAIIESAWRWMQKSGVVGGAFAS